MKMKMPMPGFLKKRAAMSDAEDRAEGKKPTAEEKSEGMSAKPTKWPPKKAKR